MRTVAIIQARMGSTRLPGKVMLPICGKPILWHVIEAAKKSGADEVILATPPNDPGYFLFRKLEEECGIWYYSGMNGNDVLSRFGSAVCGRDCDYVIRFCGDTPMVQPASVNKLIAACEDYAAYEYDGASHVTTPIGLWPEVISCGALQRLNRKLPWHNPITESPALSDEVRLCREHVTRHFYTHPDEWKTILLPHPTFERGRYAIDTAEDYLRVKAIMEGR